MTYQINEYFLEEIALQINWKEYTFSEVWTILDVFVNQGIEFDDGTTYGSRWQEFLNNGKYKTLGQCIDEACDISGRASFTDMVSHELTEEFPQALDNFPNPPYESYSGGYIDYGGRSIYSGDPRTNQERKRIVYVWFISP